MIKVELEMTYLYLRSTAANVKCQSGLGLYTPSELVLFDLI